MRMRWESTHEPYGWLGIGQVGPAMLSMADLHARQATKWDARTLYLYLGSEGSLPSGGL